MDDKEREKRIRDLRTLIHVQNVIMESVSRERGNNFIKLCALVEARQIEAEAEIGCLSAYA